ncbi:MAG: hypothetical protein J0M04_01605 [Verrucomicrobia bacterium]|nr:hypothetical protein [Verrucomicrobiota bacterium]
MKRRSFVKKSISLAKTMTRGFMLRLLIDLRCSSIAGFSLLLVASCKQTGENNKSGDGRSAVRDKVEGGRYSGPSDSVSPIRADNKAQEIELDGLVVGNKLSEASKNRVLDYLSTHLGSGKYRESWDFVRSMPLSDAQKTNFYHFVLNRMANCGEADLAMALLNETFGSGKVRTDLLSAVYGSPALSVGDLRTARDKLEYPDERAALDRVLGRRLIYIDALDPSMFGANEPINDNDVAAIEYGLRERLKRLCNSGDLTANAAIQEGLGFIKGVDAGEVTSQRLLRGYLESAGKQAPFEVWQMLESGGLMEADLQAADGVRKSIAGAMVSKDPDQGMEILSSKPEWSACLESGIESWLQVDARAAGEWIHANKTKMTPEQVDSIALGNIRFALANSEVDSARAWLSEISSAKVRQTAEAVLQDALSESK